MGKMKKKIGLALGGGSARGFAHIGVLKVLNEAGINVDMIAGTSMGAVIGAFYCSGIDLTLMERLAGQIQRRNWLDWTFPRMGLASGDKLEQMLLLLTRKRTFAELEKPLAVVATDLVRGEKVVISDGLVARAVRASAAIPGVFCPVEFRGRMLVDGAVVERVPVHTARDMGADVVLAVDLGIYVDGSKPNHIVDVIAQSLDIMQRDLCRLNTDVADVLISPQLKHVAPGQFHKAPEAVQAGEDATRAMLPQIKEFLRKEGCSAQQT
ncbi:patatin-like phospholipase family protein [Dethiobacter alkaliphilus]|uniref:patatin-like phospholipase family protein n=1 Tax=Dethiobacter alkaliphilus TaxID=427926 RepID=UPI0022276204|nr:patatin-like phospholipase family protein [Dethiobacter alkaliphilus]MCW3489924.1 patatin-like phospholipase family protein [Dethiobacter alkaliphilus]